jgi:SpoVK/Ycf46/Vps4 family AAA+-type ATPase
MHNTHWLMSVCPGDCRCHTCSRKMNLTRGIDLKKIADKMSGSSGAELKACCTEAGMFALRERRVHVTQVRGWRRRGRWWNTGCFVASSCFVGALPPVQQRHRLSHSIWRHLHENSRGFAEAHHVL